jgi:hypothetical protein
MRKDSQELAILLYLNSPECRNETGNHTILVLDVCTDDESLWVFVVMEDWSVWDLKPLASSVHEWIEFAFAVTEAFLFCIASHPPLIL